MPPPVPLTFPEALQQQGERAPGAPLVTYYDVASGERVELSYVSYANWVAKTASLLQDELGLERGQRLVVDLPTHWLAPVWLGAAWSLGLTVATADGTGGAALVVCGPDGLARHAGTGTEVVACSLLPMGVRFRTPMPAGVTDFGEVVWSQPDRFLVLDPPSASDVAWTDSRGEVDQAGLLALPDSPSTRLATTASPLSRSGLAAFVGPLLAGAGTVWVAGPASSDRLTEIARAERAEVSAG